jgi:hypothetical protein
MELHNKYRGEQQQDLDQRLHQVTLFLLKVPN